MGTPVPLDLLPENLRPRGTPVPLDLLPEKLRPQAAPQAQAAPTQDDYKQQAIAQRGKERGFFGGVYDAVMGNELEAPKAYTPAELATRQKEITVEQKKLAGEAANYDRLAAKAAKENQGRGAAEAYAGYKQQADFARRKVQALQNEIATITKTGLKPPEAQIGRETLSSLLRNPAEGFMSIPGVIETGIGYGLGAAGLPGAETLKTAGKSDMARASELAAQAFGAPGEALNYNATAKLAADIGGGAGSVASYLVPGAATRLAGAGRGLTGVARAEAIAKAARPFEYGLGTVQGAQQGIQDIQATEQRTGKVVPDVNAFAAILLNAGIGATEVGVAKRIFESVPVAKRGAALDAVSDIVRRGTAGKVDPSIISKSISRALNAVESRAAGRVAVRGAEEALQEGGVQLGTNVIAQQLYDKDRKTFEGVGYNALIGGIVGGGLRGGVEVGTKLVKKVVGETAEATDTDEEVIAPKVYDEFMQLYSQHVAGIMEANPGLTQAKAVLQITADEARAMLDTAAETIAARSAESGTGQDSTTTPAGGPTVGIDGGDESGIPNAGAAGASTTDVGQSGQTNSGELAGDTTASDTSTDTSTTQQGALDTTERDAAFKALSDAQRGAPEAAMLAAQTDTDTAAAVPGYNTYTNLLENVGDLTNRMANPDTIGGGYSKVENALVVLGNEVDAARLADIPVTPQMEAYAAAHEQLPVYNEPQRLARDAAVALGRKDFETVKANLTTLKEMQDNGVLQEEAAKFELNFGQPVQEAVQEADQQDTSVQEAVQEEQQAAPIPTPQQILEDLNDFAITEAQDRDLDEDAFLEGVADVRDGGGPLAYPDALQAYGSSGKFEINDPNADKAHSRVAGAQWAQERVAEAQAAPENQQVFDSIEEAPNDADPADFPVTPSSADIVAQIEQLPEPSRVHVRARLDKALGQFSKDNDVGRLVGSLEALRTEVDGRIGRNEDKKNRPKVRGFERAMEVLYRAEREGTLSPEAAGLVRWLLEKNPVIADDLAFSIKEGANSKSAGQYNAITRIAYIFSSKANVGTATHEVLHHLERLLPERIRKGIRAAWMKRIQNLITLAEKNGDTDALEVLGTIVQSYYGDAKAQKLLREAYSAGDIPLGLYHLSNPSEFWAVTATDIVGKRAMQTGWQGEARTWLRGFIEKVKDLFGLANDSAVIAGLNSIFKVESGTISGQMLSAGTTKFNMYAGEKARHANLSKLDEAQAMEAAGALSGPTGATFAKTGWFRGVDGRWRFEINDSAMSLKPGYGPTQLKAGRPYLLGQIVDHPELFKQYPDLRQITVVVGDSKGGGHWDAPNNMIVIAGAQPKTVDTYIDTLVHEIQHAVQSWEGFANGASPSRYPISNSALDKALSYLDKNTTYPLYLWPRWYDKTAVAKLRDDIKFIRDNFGDDIEKATAFQSVFRERFKELKDEETRRNQQAEQDWLNGNHPEAVKLRQLTAALDAARNTAGVRQTDLSLSPEERAAARNEYDAAFDAESAQYRYVKGLIATGVVPRPDLDDLNAIAVRLKAENKEVTKLLDDINNLTRDNGVNTLLYYLTSGEVEARDTEQRLRMPEAIRQIENPYIREQFGSPSDMIVIDKNTGVSSSLPSEEVNKAVKLTKAQIKQAEIKAGIQRQKIDNFQTKLVKSRSATEANADLGALLPLSHNGDGMNVLRALWKTLNVSSLNKILFALDTANVLRWKGDEIKNLRVIDRVMQDVIVYRQQKLQKLNEELSKWDKFGSKFPKGNKALGDIMMSATFYDVDPALAPNADAYMKRDAKLLDLIGNNAKPGEITRRKNEIRRVYEGGVLDKAVGNAPAGTIVRGWNDLTRADHGAGAGKAIYTMARDAYRRNFDEHYDLLMRRIDDSGLKEEDADAAKDYIEKMFADARKKVVYFPAMRFGQYWFSIGKGANSEFHTFESMSARNVALERVKSQMKEANDTRGTEEGDDIRELRNKINTKEASYALKNIFDMIEGGRVEDMEGLKDTIFQMYLMALPESDMRKRFTERKFKTGFSLDMKRNFTVAMHSGANQLARLANMYRLRNAIGSAYAELQGNTQAAMLKPFVKTMEDRAMTTVQPSSSPWDKWINLGTKITAFWLMSAPRTALIEITQLHAVGIPVMGAEFGAGNAAAAVARYQAGSLVGNKLGTTKKDSNGEIITNWGQPSIKDSKYIADLAESNPELHEAMVYAWNYGNDHDGFNSTYSSDLTSRGKRGSDEQGVGAALKEGRPLSALSQGAQATMDFMMGGFHHMGRINREIMFMSSFELAYNRAIKAGKDVDVAKQEAAEIAMKLTNEALFNYTDYNKAPLMKNRVMRIPTQFMTYSSQMTSLLVRNFYGMLPLLNEEGKAAAAKTFFGTLGMTAIYAGLRGLPFGILFALAEGMRDWFRDDDDEAYKYMDDKGDPRGKVDLNYWFVNSWIPNTFGKDSTIAKTLGLSDESAAVLARGAEYGAVSELTGWNLSDSMSLDNLWFTSKDDRETGEKGFFQTVGKVVTGPLGSIAGRVIKGRELWEEGYHDRAVESWLPAFAANPAKAYRLGKDGLRLPDGTLVRSSDYYTMGKLLAQSAGLNDTATAQMQQHSIMEFNIKSLIEQQKNALFKQYLVADEQASLSPSEKASTRLEEKKKAILKFNMNFPDMAIGDEQITEAIIRRRENAAEREAALVQ